MMMIMMKKSIMCRIRFLTLLIFHDITIFNHWGFQEGIIGKNFAFSKHWGFQAGIIGKKVPYFDNFGIQSSS